MLAPSLRALAALTLAASTVTAKVFNKDNLKDELADERRVPNRYIVELTDSSALGRRDGLTAHERFETHLKRASVDYSVGLKYDTPSIFVGASISVSDSDIAAVSKLSSVKAVYPVRVVPRPEAINAAAVDGAPQNPTDTLSIHQMTGVDKLHNMGILGKGVVVGEVDTGIDWKHPALGGCFGPGCKVSGGYDFVGDNYSGPGGAGTPQPDDDPLDCAGHGTHVAGIVAAGANPLNFTGVAPEATLRGYRVFGCTGNTGNDLVIAGMLRAFNDGVDIITISIGGADGWSEGAGSVVAQRITEQGVPLTISAGNSGSEGMFYTSDPSGGIGVISVSSVQNTVTPQKFIAVSNGAGYPYISSTTTFPTGQIPVGISTTDTSVADDGCAAYASGFFAGKAAVIRRGTCSFAIKAQNALDAGAVLLILYNNAPGTISPTIGDVQIPFVMISSTDGPALIAAATSNPSITVSFPDGYINVPNTFDGGLVSDFTSYGPTFDLLFKPSIAAPGGNILSTYVGQTYQVDSGTSMAAPFMAGVAALFIGHNGKIAPDALHSIFQSTATPIPSSFGGSALNTVAQQGAGLINAYAAVLPTAYVTPSQIALNDTAHLVGPQTITVNNLGSSSKSYRLSNVPAQTALTFGANGNQPNLGPPPLVGAAASVAFSTTFLTVPAGGSATFVATITPPTSQSASNIPVYSGWIAIETDDGSEKHQVVYQGVAASMHDDFPVLDQSDEYFGVKLPSLLTASGNFVPPTAAAATYTFSGTDAPAIVYRLLGGAQRISLDLVSASTTVGPVRKRALPFTTLSARQQTSSIVGNLDSAQYLYRHVPDSQDQGVAYDLWDIGTSRGLFFSSGAKVPNGSYKVLFRALKFYGNPANEADYETFLSPEIIVNQS